MIRMIDHTFQKSAILKLPKLVTCPSLRLWHSLLKGEGSDGGVCYVVDRAEVNQRMGAGGQP
jgi:hypothetical protein